jgi:hypothetical protein
MIFSILCIYMNLTFMLSYNINSGKKISKLIEEKTIESFEKEKTIKYLITL